jgi:hypothetical protein
MDSAKASALLLEKLCSAPCASAAATPGTAVRVANDHWSLDVAADGSAARFRDADVEARAHATGRDVSQRLSASALEEAGKAFIASRLASVIVLAPGEEVVPVSTDYRIDAGLDLTTGEATKAVVANRIVFGRTLQGVPVVGGGSTVVVTFANDGSVEGFQYDWPEYGTANSQTVADHAEIVQRLQRVIGARSGAAAPAFRATSAAREDAFSSNPFRLAQDTSLQTLECGYYDPGAAARDTSAPVQAGCIYHAVFQDKQGTRRGFAGAVPAGAAIEPDESWKETLLLTNAAAVPAPNAPGNAR